MKKIVLIVLLSALSGCVLAPVPYQQGPVVEVEPAYVWDAAIGAFFFVDIYGHRSYMPRGWHRGYGRRY